VSSNLTCGTMESKPERLWTSLLKNGWVKPWILSILLSAIDRQINWVGGVPQKHIVWFDSKACLKCESYQRGQGVGLKNRLHKFDSYLSHNTEVARMAEDTVLKTAGCKSFIGSIPMASAKKNGSTATMVELQRTVNPSL
jgi:hypothetical protein